MNNTSAIFVMCTITNCIWILYYYRFIYFFKACQEGHLVGTAVVYWDWDPLGEKQQQKVTLVGVFFLLSCRREQNKDHIY